MKMFRMATIIIGIFLWSLPCVVYCLPEGGQGVITDSSIDLYNEDVQLLTTKTDEIIYATASEKQSGNVDQSITPNSSLWAILKDIWKTVREDVSLITATAAAIATIVSLYLGVIKPWRNRPRLEICFLEKKEYPYFHKLSAGDLPLPVELDGFPIYLSVPCFNARVKVYNKGKSTSKKTEARVEKIVFVDETTEEKSTRFYHPTKIKWSGERYHEPVDIVSKSYFFLDLFLATNRTIDEIVSFNHTKYKGELSKDSIGDTLRKNKIPSGEAYWNIWVDTSFARGIPERINFQGKIIIYIVINADNCDSIKFQAHINWSKEKWNEPDIQIKMRNSFVNSDIDEGEHNGTTNHDL